MKKQSCNKSPITIYELKRRNKASGGEFFRRKSMKFFGETLKDFSIRRDDDPAKIVLTRKRDGKRYSFYVESGRVTWD